MHINFGVIMIYDLLYYKSCENADGLIIDITILQVKTYIVALLEGKSHTRSSTIGVMT